MQLIPLPPQPAAKKRNTWLWVLLGCGGLTVIGVIVVLVVGYFLFSIGEHVADNPVRTAAKVVEFINPDIEVLSVDEEKELVTFRDKRTGEVTTISLEELKKQQEKKSSESKPPDNTAQSKPSSESATPEVGGQDGLPNWVVLYPGAKVIAKLKSGTGNKASGTLMLKTDDGADAVLRFYEERLKGDGFSVTPTVVGNLRALSAKRNSGEALVIMAAPEDGDEQDDTQITITYQVQ